MESASNLIANSEHYSVLVTIILAAVLFFIIKQNIFLILHCVANFLFLELSILLLILKLR